jgi:outer membrane protein assembly factor BamB
MYQYYADHNAVFPQPRVSVAWTRRLGGKINGGLAFSRNALFVESFDRRVTALEMRSGAILWTTPVSGVVMTTPIVADGIVVVGTGTSQELLESASRVVWGRPQGDRIIALSAGSGRILWSYRTVGEDMPSPALVRVHGEDAIIFANGDNHVRVLRLRDGHLLWQRAVDGIATMSSVAVSNGYAYVVVGGTAYSKGGESLLKIDPSTGRTVWRAPYGNADCSPTVAYGRVFVQGSASDANRPANRNAFNDVVAVDETTGRLRWRWYSDYGTFTGAGSDEQGIAGMAADGALYQAIPATNEFVAFDVLSGAVRWRVHTEAAVKMSAVESDGRLYFGDTGHTLYTVNARTGKIEERRWYPTFFSVSSPVIFGDTLYVANNYVVRAVPLGTKRSANPSMQ